MIKSVILERLNLLSTLILVGVSIEFVAYLNGKGFEANWIKILEVVLFIDSFLFKIIYYKYIRRETKYDDRTGVQT